MLKNFTRRFLYLTLFIVFGVISGRDARAQTDPIIVQPTAIYRFQISFWDGGHLLTHVFQEGSANGHTFDPFNHPTFDGLGIYRPPDGYTADPSTGLVPLHRWRVVQSGWRVYYYYSIYFAPHGSDYHYEGVAGWVFPPNRLSIFHPAFVGGTLPLHPLQIWYSTDLGFWYGYGIFPGNFVEQPPNRPGKSNYLPQGLIASLPPTCIDPQFQQQPPPGGLGCPYGMRFNPPAAPPPPTTVTCSASQAIKSKCAQLGGSWNNETCSCEY
jgi:hypothetical protein